MTFICGYLDFLYITSYAAIKSESAPFEFAILLLELLLM